MIVESARTFREHELVVLQHDVPDLKLAQGDIGTVVGLYADQLGFEVEFITAKGRTIAVLTLERADIRPFVGNEILHSRQLETA